LPHRSPRLFTAILLPICAALGARAGLAQPDVLYRMPPKVLDRLSPLERRALEAMTPDQTIDVLNGADPRSIDLADGTTLADLLATEAGGPGQELVYSPVTPCRLVDTRLAGGALTAGSPRHFQARGNNLSNQGGDPAGCGLPLGVLLGGSSDTAIALALHVTAVAPSGPGHLLGWEWNTPKPSTSFLGYAAVAGLNPSTSTVMPVATWPVCPTPPTCADFSIEAASTTHLVVDVVGYFRPHVSHYGQTWTGGSALALSLEGPDTTLQLRNTNDPLGAFVKNTWSSLQFGLFNPGSTASGEVKPGEARSFFGFDSTGRVGSLTNVAGGPAYRNVLDDGRGNAKIQGDLEARNLPGIAFHQEFSPVTVTGSATVALGNATIRVPAPGVLQIQATAQGQGCNELRILETTGGGAATLTKGEEKISSRHSIALQFARTTDIGTFSFSLEGLRTCTNQFVTFFDRNLVITYLPRDLR
jgi:hypothetical protein